MTTYRELIMIIIKVKNYFKILIFSSKRIYFDKNPKFWISHNVLFYFKFHYHETWSETFVFSGGNKKNVGFCVIWNLNFVFKFFMIRNKVFFSMYIFFW